MLFRSQVRRKQLINMKDWLERTNSFLDGNRLDILPNAGNISHQQALDKAHAEYEVFRVVQDKNYLSEFDKVIGKIKSAKP